MKHILLAFICALFSGAAFAQKDSLSFDENNKYIYYQTVDQPQSVADTLYDRGLYFINTAYPKTNFKLSKADKAGNALLAKGSFMVSKKSLLTSRLDGEIKYDLKIEVKDSKYRFWLTDFIYMPYQLNRYNSFERVPGIEIPLEHAQDKLDARDIKAYLDQILIRSREIGNKLKVYMLKPSVTKPKTDVKKINKISTKDW